MRADNAPEAGHGIGFEEVGEFVDDHVIDHEHRGLDEAPIETDIVQGAGGLWSRQLYQARMEGRGSRCVMPQQRHLATVRVLCPVVFPKPLLMSTGQSQTSERAGVGAQLVGD